MSAAGSSTGGNPPAPAPAAPPTPQEIQRKLSMHSAPTKQGDLPPGVEAIRKTARRPSCDPVSDSDAAPLPPLLTNVRLSSSPSRSPIAGPSSPVPLSAIVERSTRQQYVSGNEDDDEGEGEGEGEGEDSDEEEEEVIEQNRQLVDEENVLRSGYLEKKGGGRRKNWKKRWFVLRPTKLAFYKNDKEYRLLRLIDLPSIHTCAEVDVGKKHDNVFGIVTPDRTFYVKGRTRGEMDGWVDAINQARRRLKEAEEGVPPPAANTPNPVPPPSSPRPMPSAEPRRPSAGTLSLSRSPSSHREPSGTSLSSEYAAAEPPVSPSAGGGASSSEDEGEDGPPPPPDPNKVILSGYLMKMGKRKNWRKRFFTLTSGKLMYARSHMDAAKPHRQIPLSRILDALEIDAAAMSPNLNDAPLASSSSPTQAASSEHRFKIITAKRTFILAAPNEEEEVSWLAAVQALLARRRGDPLAAQQQQQAGASSTHAIPTIATQPPTPSISSPHAVNRSIEAALAEEDEDDDGEHMPKAAAPDAPASPKPVHSRQRSGTEVARAAVAAVAQQYHPQPAPA